MANKINSIKKHIFAIFFYKLYLEKFLNKIKITFF